MKQYIILLFSLLAFSASAVETKCVNSYEEAYAITDGLHNSGWQYYYGVFIKDGKKIIISYPIVKYKMQTCYTFYTAEEVKQEEITKQQKIQTNIELVKKMGF